MYLPTVQYQMHYQIESRLPRFHKSHRKNLVLMVVGMAYQKSVQLPQIAQGVCVGKTQIEGRVQRFERVVQCPKLEVLEALQPTATKVLQQVSRGGKRRMVLVLHPKFFLTVFVFIALSLSNVAPFVSATRRQQSDGKGQTVRQVAQLPAPAKRYALLIGVDSYDDGHITGLLGAANDAKVLEDALVDNAGFDRDRILRLSSDQLLDRQPTRALREVDPHLDQPGIHGIRALDAGGPGRAPQQFEVVVLVVVGVALRDLIGALGAVAVRREAGGVDVEVGRHPHGVTRPVEHGERQPLDVALRERRAPREELTESPPRLGQIASLEALTHVGRNPLRAGLRPRRLQPHQCRCGEH